MPNHFTEAAPVPVKSPIRRRMYLLLKRTDAETMDDLLNDIVTEACLRRRLDPLTVQPISRRMTRRLWYKYSHGLWHCMLPDPPPL